jgi:hypothetical protein
LPSKFLYVLIGDIHLAAKKLKSSQSELIIFCAPPSLRKYKHKYPPTKMEKTTKADDTLTDAVTIVISAVASFQDMLSESTLTAVRAAAEVEGGGGCC